MTDFKKLKAGTKLSESSYYTVEKVSGDEAQLLTDTGDNVVIDKLYIEKLMITADQFTKTEILNRTDAIQKFLANPGIVMTVNFNKQVKDTDVITEITSAYENSTPKTFEDAVKKAIKKGMQGEERTMVGRHFGELNEFGRVNFIDMEAPSAAGKSYDSRLRQVDPRTINWFIVKEVMYKVK